MVVAFSFPFTPAFKERFEKQGKKELSSRGLVYLSMGFCMVDTKRL